MHNEEFVLSVHQLNIRVDEPLPLVAPKLIVPATIG
jgi:hypothetical protein